MEVLDHGHGFLAEAVAVRNPRALYASLDDLQSETGHADLVAGVFAVTVAPRPRDRADDARDARGLVCEAASAGGDLVSSSTGGPRPVAHPRLSVFCPSNLTASA
jgi:hypothetical protein